MQFTNLFDDDRAVSPVIGVILMVAITVILAAVIGTFVLGMSDQMGDNAPRASFGFDTIDDDGTDGIEQVTITHESGATIDGTDLVIKSTKAFSAGSGSTWESIDGGTDVDVSAGSSITLDQTGTPADFSGATIRVVYSSADSDSTTTLQKFEVPN